MRATCAPACCQRLPPVCACLQLGLFGDKKFTSYEEVLRFFSSKVRPEGSAGLAAPVPPPCRKPSLPAKAQPRRRPGLPCGTGMPNARSLRCWRPGSHSRLPSRPRSPPRVALWTRGTPLLTGTWVSGRDMRGAMHAVFGSSTLASSRAEVAWSCFRSAVVACGQPTREAVRAPPCLAKAGCLQPEGVQVVGAGCAQLRECASAPRPGLAPWLQRWTLSSMMMLPSQKRAKGAFSACWCAASAVRRVRGSCTSLAQLQHCPRMQTGLSCRQSACFPVRLLAPFTTACCCCLPFLPRSPPSRRRRPPRGGTCSSSGCASGSSCPASPPTGRLEAAAGRAVSAWPLRSAVIKSSVALWAGLAGCTLAWLQLEATCH